MNRTYKMGNISAQTATMLQEIEQEELNKNRDLIHSFSKYCKERDIILEAKNFHYMHTIGCYVEYPTFCNLYPVYNQPKMAYSMKTSY